MDLKNENDIVYHILPFISSKYAVTHVRNTNSNIQMRSPNVVKVILHTIRYFS